jgi:WD40 repeat protein
MPLLLHFLSASVLSSFLLSAQEEQIPGPTCSRLFARTESDTSVLLKAIALSSDGSAVAGGYSDGKVVIWDTTTGKVIDEYVAHGVMDNGAKYPDPSPMDSESVTCLLFFKTDNILLSGGKDGSLRLWDYKLHKTQARLISPAQAALEAKGPLKGDIHALEVELLSNSPSAVDVSLNGTQVVSASGKNIAVWDVTKQLVRIRLDGHKGYIASLSLSPDADRLVSGSRDGTVRVWDLKAGVQLKQLGMEHGLIVDMACPLRVVWSHDGKAVVVAYDHLSNNLTVLSADTWVSGSQSSPTAAFSTVTALPEGSAVIFAADTPPSQVVRWDSVSSKLMCFSTSSAHRAIWYLSLAHNGKRLATVGKDKKIALWQLDDLKWSDCKQ